MLHAGAIFASALLLFLVQPVMARSILPWFGGSAGVWATCMLFFQVLLLGGYAYAHGLTRLSARTQAIVHTALLAASVAVLPIAPAPIWKQLAEAHPMVAILGVLAASIGLPYFLLSTSSPLLQNWYSRERTGASPYRLYSLSNLASLAALLAYPFVLEPLLPLHAQRLAWSVAYAGCAGLCAVAAWRGAHRETPEPAKEPLVWRQRLVWLALAACPAAMWMAIANQLSQSVAAVPFLWILPLSLYLLTFVLCFEREGWYSPARYRYLFPPGCLAIGFGLAQQHSSSAFKWGLGLFAAGLFVCAMFCHGELARRKPAPCHLTSFYLTVAAGGAIGGAFVALVAPHIFSTYYELPVSTAACLLLGLTLLYGYSSPRHLARLGLVTVIGFTLGIQMRASLDGGTRVRNFYGALEIADGHGPNAMRVLYNGSIIHGSQFLALGTGRIPTTYYGMRSGAGQLLSHPGGARRVGVIGLGVGTLAAYGRAGDYYRFYEINPEVIRLAREKFRFLWECPARWDVVAGDGRLSLEREPAQEFDVLVLDAFTGDSIPVHLLTREAFSLYFHHLTPEGILAVHATNKYLDLAPVIVRLAEAAGRPWVVVRSAGDPGRSTNGAVWVLAGRAPVLREIAGERSSAIRHARLWTDDYSNLFQVLK